jgi:hypothetical protein
MCSHQSFSERPPPLLPPEQCFLATSDCSCDTDCNSSSFRSPRSSPCPRRRSPRWLLGPRTLAHQPFGDRERFCRRRVFPPVAVELELRGLDPSPLLGRIASHWRDCWTVRPYARLAVDSAWLLPWHRNDRTQGPTKATRGPCLQSLNRVVTTCGVRTHAVSGGLERCMIVAAAKEVCRLQSRHSCDRARVFGSAARRSCWISASQSPLVIRLRPRPTGKSPVGRGHYI